MSKLLKQSSDWITLSLLLVLIWVTGTGSAAIRKRRAESGEPEENYEEENLKIWRESIEDVIEHKLSGMCRAMVTSVKGEGETPHSACSQLRNSKFIMRMACTSDDVDNMEEVVCGYWSIVLPTNSAGVVTPSPSEKAAPLTSSSSTTSSAQSSSSSSSSSTTSSAQSSSSSSSASLPPPSPFLSSQRMSSTQAKQAAPSNISPPQDELVIVPVPDDKSPENHLQRHPTRDNRLSETCNQIVPHVAQVVATDRDGSCTRLHHVVSVSSSDPQTTSLLASQVGIHAPLGACSKNDLHLVYSMFCRNNSNADRAHALHGQQQKRVNYVIKTELSDSCRRAVSPLGENQMEEDVTDSCLTLSGVQGEELVSNELCTRGDLDNLIKVVCDSDSASTLVTLKQQTLVLSMALLAYHLVVKLRTF